MKLDTLLKLIMVLLAAVFILVTTTSCKGGGELGSEFSTGGGGGSSGPAPTPTDVERIVTTGPGTGFNNLHASHPRLKLNPSTRAPAVLYYDRTQNVGSGATNPAGALKYAFMDASGTWNIEIVDGNTGTTACGTATASCVGAQNIASPTDFPQLWDFAFASDGSVVYAAYVFGSSAATGKKIRIVKRTLSCQEGSACWTEDATIAIANTVATATIGYPIKGLVMLIDSADRPHLYYQVYTTTHTNSALYYTMRASSGTWSSEVNTGLAIVTAGAVAATKGTHSNDGAICPVDQTHVLSLTLGDNAPAASNKPGLARCTTIDASGACTAWALFDMEASCAGACMTGLVAATTTGASRTSVTIDPVTNKVVYATYTTAAPANSAVTAIQSGADTCASWSAAAWTTQTYPTASMGINGLGIIAGTTNTYLTLNSTTAHVVAQTSASLGGAWTAPNTLTLETSTALVGSGFAYDSVEDALYTSYIVNTGGTAGTVLNDLRVGYALTSDISSTGMGSIETVDQALNIFPATPTYPMLATARAPNGTVGYAYFYSELGATPGVRSRLYYGIQGGTSTAPAFGEKPVFNAVAGAAANLVGTQPSLTYDSNSNPIITFIDNGTTAPANTGALMMARGADGGAYFSVKRLDGIAASSTVGRFSSVATSADYVGVSYYDYLPANLRLKFTKVTPWSSIQRFVVDGLSGATGSGCGVGVSDAGAYSKFAWTSDGLPVIAYQATMGGTRYLRMAYATEALDDTNYSWTCVTLDGLNQGANNRGDGIAFKIDSNDQIHIAHIDSTLGGIRYLTCSTPAACASATGTTIELIGSVTVGAANQPSIGINSEGTVFVSYHAPAYKTLRLATLEAGASTWLTEDIDQSSTSYSFIAGIGHYVGMFINSSGYPGLFFRSLENWVKYWSREM